ncbi:MAG: DUF1653 domain-containing protein [Candidatus Saccharimonadales bacterium]
MPEHDHIAAKPELELGMYRHYKGGEYEVVMLACHEATHEWMVIYEAQYETGNMPSIWARTYEDFTSNVEMGGETLPRFIKI